MLLQADVLAAVGPVHVPVDAIGKQRDHFDTLLAVAAAVRILLRREKRTGQVEESGLHYDVCLSF